MNETPPSAPPDPGDAGSEHRRRRSRWAARASGVGLGGLLLLVGTLLAAVSTDTGLGLLRPIALRLVNGALAGRLEVGALKGSLLSRLVIEDVRLLDDEGRDAVTLARAELAWRPTRLTSGVIAVEELLLVKPRVRLVETSTGGLNLGRLVPPSGAPEPEAVEDSGPLRLPAIQLATLRIEEGAVEYRKDGRRVARAEQLALQLSGETGGTSAEVRGLELGAVVQSGVLLRLSASARWDDPTLTVRDLELDADEARVRIPSATAQLPLGEVLADARVLAPAEVVRRLGGPPQLRADPDLRLSARRSDGGRWVASVEGELAGPRRDARMSATATVSEDLGQLSAKLRLRAVDPRRLWADAPPGRLDLDASARRPPGPFAVAVQTELRGRLRPTPDLEPVVFQPLGIRLRVRDDRVDVEARGRVSDARLDLEADTRIGGGALRIARGRLRVDAPNLERILPGLASGGLAVTATVAGPIEDLTARADVRGRGLQVGPARLDRLDATADLRNLPFTPNGQVELLAAGVELPDRSLERVALTARARSDEGAVRADVEQLILRSGGVAFRSEGARLSRSPDGTLRVEDLRVGSPAGRVEASGSLAPDGALESRLTVAALDLARLPRALVPELGELRGRIDASARLMRRAGATRGRVELDLTRFALKADRPELSGHLEGTLRPGRIEAKLSLDGLMKRASARALLPAPRDALDGAAWGRAMSSSPVREASVDLAAVDVARLQRFLGLEEHARGALGLTAEVRRGGRDADLALELADVELPSVPGARSDLTMEAHLHGGRLTTNGRVVGRPLGDGTFTATVALPGSLFDADGWRRLGPSSVRGAEVSLDDLRLAALEELQLASGFSGAVDLHLKARPKLTAVDVELHAADLRVPGFEGRLDVDADAGTDPKHTRLELAARLDGAEVLAVDADVPLTSGRLLAGLPPLDTLPLRARLRARGLPVPRLAPLVGLDGRALRGEIEGEADFAGTLTEPEGQARLAVVDIAIQDRKFDDLVLTASVADSAFGARTRFSARGGGGLSASVQGRLDGDEGPTGVARLDGDGLDLRFLSRLGLLPLGLDGALHADVRAPFEGTKVRPKGQLEIRELRVVFEQPQLQPLYDGKLTVELDEQVARLKLNASSLEGDVELTGRVDATSGRRAELEAQAKLSKFPVNAGQLTEVDLDVDVTGGIDPVEGTEIAVALSDGHVTFPTRSERTLHPITSPAEVEFVERLDEESVERVAAGPGAPSAPVEVKVTTREPIEIKGEPVDAELRVDLVAHSGPEGTGVDGRVWVPVGQLKLTEWEYVIDRADVLLEGRSPPDPRLDVRLSHRFAEEGLDFFVRVSGLASDPKVEFSSSPARYSQAELLQIFLGTRPSELGQTDSRSAEQKAAGAAAGFLAGELSKSLGEAVPFDTLKIDTTDTGGAASYTLGRWLSREIFLAYRQHFAPGDFENEFEAIVQWRFLPGWMVELVLGLVRNEVDLIWINRW